MEISEIKKYMKEKKITQETLAKQSNISISTIKKIMSGYIQNPRLDTINAILSALNMPIEIPTNGNFRSPTKNKAIIINNSGDEYEYNLTKEQANAVINLLESFNK